MDKEIREYSLQLQAVQDSLSTDPGNEELKALEDELKDLIDLISSQKKEPAAENEQGNQAKYAVGQKVVANWVSGDGRFYPARITSIAGAANQPMFTVTFLHYANTETLGLSGVREMNDTMAQDQSTTNQGKSQTERKSSSARVQPTSEPTKPIPHRQNDKPEPKVGEVQAVQSKWQKFAQKGVKRYVLDGNEC